MRVLPRQKSKNMQQLSTATRAPTSSELHRLYRRYQEPIARRKGRQRACYSGHKRHYCQACQAVVMPDGIVMHIHGPIDGSHYDIWLYQHSGLFDTMAQHAYGAHGRPRCIYGDPGYRRLNVHLASPWQGVRLSLE